MTMAGTDTDPYLRLAATDEVLRGILDRHGRPDPFAWTAEPRVRSDNFAAMVLHITSQEISTIVAQRIFGRLEEAVGGLPTPQGIVRLGAQGLRAVGMSTGKSTYLLDLAYKQLDGSLDVNALSHCDDEQVVTALSTVKGVGRWTSEMFLIHQLGRPDVLPAGDLGIRRAVQLGWAQDGLPPIAAVHERALLWAPFRTYAAALLWASLGGPPR